MRGTHCAELLGPGANPVDPRDVFALGVILYELLTGRRPFLGNSLEVLQQVTTTDAPPPRGLNRRIPQELDAICLKALQRDPARRYASAGALAEALQAFLAAVASPTKRPRTFWK